MPVALSVVALGCAQSGSGDRPAAATTSSAAASPGADASPYEQLGKVELPRGDLFQMTPEAYATEPPSASVVKLTDGARPQSTGDRFAADGFLAVCGGSLVGESPDATAMVAVDAGTGAVVWTRPVPDGSDGWAPFCAADGQSLLAWEDRSGEDRLHALDLATGQDRWAVEVASRDDTRVTDSTVFVDTTAGQVTAYRVADGSVAWSRPDAGDVWMDGHYGVVVRAVAGRAEYRTTLLDDQTGDVLLELPADLEPDPERDVVVGTREAPAVVMHSGPIVTSSGTTSLTDLPLVPAADGQPPGTVRSSQLASVFGGPGGLVWVSSGTGGATKGSVLALVDPAGPSVVALGTFLPKLAGADGPVAVLGDGTMLRAPA